MKFSTLLRFIRFWPPFLGSGISVKSFNSECSSLIVQMKMRFWNKNYVGTHYGGSLYSMTDPFYMLMLMNQLGKNYIVWDKSATIRYKRPAKGTVYAHFDLSQEQIDLIKTQVETDKKAEPEFKIKIASSEGVIIAEINKIIHVSKKIT